MSKDELQILTEYMDGQFAKLAEALDARIGKHLAPIKEKVDRLDQDMQIVKAVLKATGKDIKALENRTKKLEGTTAANSEIIKTLDAHVQANSRDMQSLDRATGNVEHRTHNLQMLVTNHYLGSIEHDRELLHELEERVGKLEDASA